MYRKPERLYKTTVFESVVISRLRDTSLLCLPVRQKPRLPSNRFSNIINDTDKHTVSTTARDTSTHTEGKSIFNIQPPQANINIGNYINTTAGSKYDAADYLFWHNFSSFKYPFTMATVPVLLYEDWLQFNCSIYQKANQPLTSFFLFCHCTLSKLYTFFHIPAQNKGSLCKENY